MSKVSLLIWIGNGKRIEALAMKSGREQKPEWNECLFRGWFDIEVDGRLVLTPDGASELQIERASVGGWISRLSSGTYYTSCP